MSNLLNYEQLFKLVWEGSSHTAKLTDRNIMKRTCNVDFEDPIETIMGGHELYSEELPEDRVISMFGLGYMESKLKKSLPKAYKAVMKEGNGRDIPTCVEVFKKGWFGTKRSIARLYFDGDLVYRRQYLDPVDPIEKTVSDLNSLFNS